MMKEIFQDMYQLNIFIVKKMVGHISTNCSKKDEGRRNVMLINRDKVIKEVKLFNHSVEALIDTVSDITVIRENFYEKIGSPVL